MDRAWCAKGDEEDQAEGEEDGVTVRIASLQDHVASGELVGSLGLIM